MQQLQLLTLSSLAQRVFRSKPGVRLWLQIVRGSDQGDEQLKAIKELVAEELLKQEEAAAVK